MLHLSLGHGNNPGNLRHISLPLELAEKERLEPEQNGALPLRFKGTTKRQGA
jgi:hypothetical protein